MTVGITLNYSLSLNWRLKIIKELERGVATGHTCRVRIAGSRKLTASLGCPRCAPAAVAKGGQTRAHGTQRRWGLCSRALLVTAPNQNQSRGPQRTAGALWCAHEAGAAWNSLPILDAGAPSSLAWGPCPQHRYQSPVLGDTLPHTGLILLGVNWG